MIAVSAYDFSMNLSVGQIYWRQIRLAEDYGVLQNRQSMRKQRYQARQNTDVDRDP